MGDPRLLHVRVALLCTAGLGGEGAGLGSLRPLPHVDRCNTLFMRRHAHVRRVRKVGACNHSTDDGFPENRGDLHLQRCGEGQYLLRYLETSFAGDVGTASSHHGYGAHERA